ncbi:helix-turn-helix transcriptional regulator [Streptacidiphilus sp. P02-A3a]|uniref:helix-turn-helix domain-containing protein n=1 Tax=Streptacidiphilus sp. P02-A3a TaxID=2704468 RepID=UPI0015FC4B78|nr:helix-turn-helix transcriptional regulator [Streptacidiphilus sp. P02-A3a]QMU68681.1 helix-turn-helix domain-containing protein [Streptacidiphilus sp. P02-A3a]
MAAKLGTTGRRLELGLQLRGLREKTGLTRKQAIVGLKISEATLARIEAGSLSFRNVGDLRKLLEKYEVTDEETIDAIIERNREVPAQDWLTQYRGVMPPGMPNFVGLETEARQIRAFEPSVVHGLLQTEGYARTLFEMARAVEDTTMDFVNRSVDLRMERKDVLTRDPDPLNLRVILGEAALRYAVGGPDVMLGQYAEIARLSALPNLTIQVLPTASRGYRSRSDFSILDLGEKLPRIIQVDTAWGAVSTSDKRHEVDRFNRRFDAMTASALPPEDTPEFMHRLERELTDH